MRLPWALARAIPAFTRSLIKALSNWASEAMTVNKLALWGHGVNVFLIRDKVHAQAVEFVQRMHQRLVDRANRSYRETNTTSMWRFRATANNA